MPSVKGRNATRLSNSVSDKPGMCSEAKLIDIYPEPAPWMGEMPAEPYSKKFKDLVELKNPQEKAKLILEVEEVIRAIRDGEIEGEYFEF